MEGWTEKEVREEYEKKVCGIFREARMRVGDKTSVNVGFDMSRDIVTTVAVEAVGYRV